MAKRKPRPLEVTCRCARYPFPHREEVACDEFILDDRAEQEAFQYNRPFEAASIAAYEAKGGFKKRVH